MLFRSQHDAKRLRDLGFTTRAGALVPPELHFDDLTPVVGGFERLHKELLEYLRNARGEVSATANPGRPGRGRDKTDTATDAGEEDGLLIEELEFQGDEPTEVPDEVFRDYDIRGRSAQFSPALVDLIGRAIASEALDNGCNTIEIGRAHV